MLFFLWFAHNVVKSVYVLVLCLKPFDFLSFFTRVFAKGTLLFFYPKTIGRRDKPLASRVEGREFSADYQ